MSRIPGVFIKWGSDEREIKDIFDDTTIAELKARIYEETDVRPDRQKLLNLRLRGKLPEDEQTVASSGLKPGAKLVLMGFQEDDIDTDSNSTDNTKGVMNDLNNEQDYEQFVFDYLDVYLSKIYKRIENYKIKELNPLREDKKLLVLDIDYTLFDHRSRAFNGIDLMRPYLHEFLTRAYKHYDIVIWSATSMKWINEKMQLLGVADNPDYKIAFYLDYLAMISVSTPNDGPIDVKPLGVIWGKYPGYSEKNTIMLDDISRNFLMNPKSGLRIRPFRQPHSNRDKDRELLKLAEYLELVAHVHDFQMLHHGNWEEYKSPKPCRRQYK